MRGAAWLSLLLVVAAPHAGATRTESEFVLSQPFSLDRLLRASFEEARVLQEDTGDLQSFRLDASRVVLHYYTRPLGPVGLEPLVLVHGPWDHEVVTFQDAFIEMESSEAGVLALLAKEGGVEVFPATPTRFFQAAAPEGATRTDRDQVPPGIPWGLPPDPRVVLEGPGKLAHAGAGVVRVDGIDLLVHAAGETVRYPTGQQEGALGSLRTEEDAFAFLEYERGRLEMDSRVPLVVLGSTAHAVWDGLASFRAAEATFREGDDERMRRGMVVVLSGRFAADLAPSAGGLRMRTGGDLVEPLAPAPVGLFAGTGWIVLAGVCAVVGGGLVLQRRALLRRPPVPIEDCVAAAEAAITQEDWPGAAEWLERARRMAGPSARLDAELAYALLQTGRDADAWRLFQEARARGMEEPEFLFEGARAAGLAGGCAEDAEAWLVAALERGPGLVTEADGPAFDMLRGRPGFERAVERAWERVAGGGPGGAA